MNFLILKITQLKIYILDFPIRVIRKSLLIIQHRSKFSIDSDWSDSQVTGYEKAVKEAINSPKKFSKFRRLHNYRTILEHLSYKQGLQYLTHVNEIDSSLISKFQFFNQNYNVGKPYCFTYSGIGKISPTTLRYIAVAGDLSQLFDLEGNLKIAEIGVGYGGQFQVLSYLFPINSYSMFDLPDVLTLAKMYLEKSRSGVTICESLTSIQTSNWDLVISNYAFSELPISLQREYLAKVLLKSKSGYMIMNSGRTNVTGRSEGKMTLNELKSHFPDMVVFEEEPLTHPDNYVVAWGINK